MKKQLFLTTFILFLTGFIFLMPRTALAQEPVDMVHSVADQMIAGLKSNQATLQSNPTLVYSLANKIIVPHADLDMMAKRVLPPQTWNSASAAQRSQFKKEFTTLLVRTYASALANYSDQTIKFFPVRGGTAGKTTVKVDSQIVRSDGPAIPVTYQLISSGSQWKVYDMAVEGISMLESFRSQFADKLQSGDINALLAALQQHNAANSGA